MSITYPSVTLTDTVNAQTPGALVCYFRKDYASHNGKIVLANQ